MKRVIFLLLLAVSFSANSQTLKELLYSGKLKNDSNTVVRKTDDLSTKIDTAQKKKVEPAQQKVGVPAIFGDTIKKTNPQTGTVSSETDGELVTVRETISKTEAAPTPPPPPAAPTKTTTRIWKEYTDSLVKVLQAEVMSNKKIKKETYFITADYDLDLDGKVTVTNVIVNPENGILAAAVTDRMQISPPQLAPVPRKIKRKVNFTITKD
ncbi:MAG: hypothetical protein ACXWV9_02870 [Flavisolibacter sp.]